MHSTAHTYQSHAAAAFSGWQAGIVFASDSSQSGAIEEENERAHMQKMCVMTTAVTHFLVACLAHSHDRSCKHSPQSYLSLSLFLHLSLSLFLSMQLRHAPSFRSLSLSDTATQRVGFWWHKMQYNKTSKCTHTSYIALVAAYMHLRLSQAAHLTKTHRFSQLLY